MQTTLVGLMPVLLIVVADGWVFTDARTRQGTNRGVSVQIGSFRVDRPEAWLAWCAVLFVVFFPLYLVARRASS